ncbi:MAG: hypothetical protein DHS20C18_14170 [Saprospiraceae bacterium]|nr:MAG: hypothetical protein DHS20C18_14170 [Saprospiraceae bacterium]
MKKLLTFVIVLFALHNWLYYSNPNQLSEIQNPNPVKEPISQILLNPELADTYVLTVGEVSHSISMRLAGFCTIRENGREILILSRDFTPPTGAYVICKLIPRRVFGIGNRFFTVGAMVEYQIPNKIPSQQEFFEPPKEKERGKDNHRLSSIE